MDRVGVMTVSIGIGIAALCLMGVLAACGSRRMATGMSPSPSTSSLVPATVSVAERIAAVSASPRPLGGSMTGGWQVTQGWAFTPTVDFEVTDLGYIDPERDGLAHAHRVGIFDAETDRLLAATSVGRASVLDGCFRWESLREPVLLRAGHPYLVGGEFKDGDEMSDTVATWAPEVGHRGPYLNASAFAAPHDDNPWLGFLAVSFKFRRRPVDSTPLAVSGPTGPDPDNPSGRHTAWGTNREIDDVFALVKRPVTDTGATQAPGTKTVVAEIRIENVNDEPRQVSLRSFSACDQKGRTYSPARTTSTCLGDRLDPGESVRGFLAFDLLREPTVERIVWSWPVSERVDEWTWQ